MKSQEEPKKNTSYLELPHCKTQCSHLIGQDGYGVMMYNLNMIQVEKYTEEAKWWKIVERDCDHGKILNSLLKGLLEKVGFQFLKSS